MIILRIIFSIAILNNVCLADDKIINQKSKDSVNYCHDKLEIKKWEAMLIKYQGDFDIIKLYALRSGLCKAVDDKKIKLDDAIDIFNAEHLKIATEWANEAKKNEAKKGLNI